MRMTGFEKFLLFFAFSFASLAFFAGGYVGLSSGREEVMREAFEREHAVQCPGVAGYHWECGEALDEPEKPSRECVQKYVYHWECKE